MFDCMGKDIDDGAVKELARVLCLSEESVREWIRDGFIRKGGMEDTTEGSRVNGCPAEADNFGAPGSTPGATT